MNDGADDTRGIVRICITATIAGAVIGFIGGAFRWLLQAADRLRIDLVDWARELPGPGWLIPVGAAALGATLAALVVRWEPLAGGSGIQHVEAVYRGEVEPPTIRVLPAKFIGGLLAIGSGLVLGREGPTVHMGAAIGAEAGRRARLPDDEVRMMQTALGGAGLAVAFNAPIGGTLFTLEEVTRSFRAKTVLATVFAAAMAVGCARLILGDHAEFQLADVDEPQLVWLPLFVVFGLLTGLLGATYNRLVLLFLERLTASRRLPTVAKATVIGAGIGLVMVIYPRAAGGGEELTQMLLGGQHLLLGTVGALLVARFVAGPLSYSAPVVGGLFAPMLAVGALWGVLFVGVLGLVWPGDIAALAVPMAVVGMGAFFGATVRAPMTGMVLVLEMTASTAVIVPLLAATASAVLAAYLVGSPPIYDSLRQRSIVKT
ncbi:ClC family H(+)/Cl(-) exchange transporter [Mycolicibacterium sp.]|uniref:ClC family H(+)/Cl(-) exchange transporter n=1 Tax=Mycolicibacterium sp. TaxID=2320850 RepID=UPI0025F9BE6F|nr:ClC family H(+)/Cl(-) exchange transporter [Mycolicibacterium sp.]